MVQTTPVLVVVIEEDRATARQIQSCLTAHGFRVPRPVPTMDEAVWGIKEAGPDVVLVELATLLDQMVVSALRRHLLTPRTRLVCLADEAEREALTAAALLPAVGIVLKPLVEAQLVATVTLAAALATAPAPPAPAGRGPQTAEQTLRAIAALLDQAPPARDAAADGLTGREREVVDLLASGARVVTIAQQLGLSPHTVRNHLKSVFRKLNLRGQHELFEYWKRGRG